MRPLFSVTKTRPSSANRMVVGCVRPVIAVVSMNPSAIVSAIAGGASLSLTPVPAAVTGAGATIDAAASTITVARRLNTVAASVHGRPRIQEDRPARIVFGSRANRARAPPPGARFARGSEPERATHRLESFDDVEDMLVERHAELGGTLLQLIAWDLPGEALVLHLLDDRPDVDL